MPRIGIFDSGIGGLTVKRAILEALPGLDTVRMRDAVRVAARPPGGHADCS